MTEIMPSQATNDKSVVLHAKKSRGHNAGGADGAYLSLA